MIKNWLFFVIIVMAVGVTAQEQNQVIFDTAANQNILIGHCDWNAFQQNDFSDWFNQEYNAYQPDDNLMQQLSRSLKGRELSFKVYQGSWCPDSRRELPRLKKITDDLKPDVFTDIISLNRAKRLNTNALPEDDIEFVPTIVIYLDGVEVGRIVEQPDYSMEADIVKYLEEELNEE
ncbi:MAG: TlpA family protein disulfide reductase [Bacteroidales bacterium]